MSLREIVNIKGCIPHHNSYVTFGKARHKENQNVWCALGWRVSRSGWNTEFWIFKTVKLVFTAWQIHVILHLRKFHGIK